MEIRLFDIVNNKVDVRDYMYIHGDEIMVKENYLYDVILDTEKDTLHQQTELFDSKDEMFKKAKAFDEIFNAVNAPYVEYPEDWIVDVL